MAIAIVAIITINRLGWAHHGVDTVVVIIIIVIIIIIIPTAIGIGFAQVAAIDTVIVVAVRSKELHFPAKSSGFRFLGKVHIRKLGRGSMHTLRSRATRLQWG